MIFLGPLLLLLIVLRNETLFEVLLVTTMLACNSRGLETVIAPVPEVIFEESRIDPPPEPPRVIVP